MSCRRGQADSLIGILILLFIFFILFLPPGVREELLESENDTTGTSNRTGVFIDVVPGLLTPEGLERFHAIPSFLLLEGRVSSLLASSPGFTVSRGWFVRQPREFPFTLENPEITDNVLLSFQTGRREGVLRVLLNGQLAFQGEITQASPAPVKLPRELLQASNVLTFDVGGVGLAFWRQNDFDLGDIRVVGDITDKSRQEAQNTFSIDQDEYVDPEDVELFFRPSCDQAFVGALTVELNGRQISRAVPICNNQNRIDLERDVLKVGTNSLFFRSERGSFEVTGISVRVRLRQSKAYTQSFWLSRSQYNDFDAGRRKLKLILDFSDDTAVKRLLARVNSQEFEVETTDDRWEEDISLDVREGSNTVQLRPLDDVDVTRLRVRRV
jgi:hypothetical protein